jgi:hypothetical protein
MVSEPSLVNNEHIYFDASHSLTLDRWWFADLGGAWCVYIVGALLSGLRLIYVLKVFLKKFEFFYFKLIYFFFVFLDYFDLLISKNNFF